MNQGSHDTGECDITDYHRETNRKDKRQTDLTETTVCVLMCDDMANNILSV